MTTRRSKRRKKVRIWSCAEIRQFLVSTEGHHLHPVWFLAATTGMRRSELLSQQLADVDLDAAAVIVRASATQKNRRAARTVRLDHRTVEVLRVHIDSQEGVCRQVGTGQNTDGLLFPRPDGTRWAPEVITRAFTLAVEATDVPRIRLHDLRNTHAAILLAAGVDSTIVAERLGHSLAGTLDGCGQVMRSPRTQVLPRAHLEAAELFIDRVFGAGDEERSTRGG